MNKGSLLALLSLATMASASSCRCSNESAGSNAASSASASAAGVPATSLTARSFKLKNGLQVELVDGPCSAQSALVVLVEAGIDHEPAGRSGMAHLNERILAAWVGAGKAGRLVESGGGFTLYSVVAPTEQLLKELDSVAAWLAREPTEQELKSARELVLAELATLSGEDAAATARRYAEESVAPTRENGRRRGIVAEVEAITLEEVKAYWAAHFKAGNTRIAVAGPLNSKKTRAHIEATFGKLPSGTPALLGKPGDSTVKGTMVMGEAPKAVAIAVPAPGVADALYPSFLVLASRLLTKPPKPRDWQVSYDPIRRPEVLFITGAVGPAEQPEPAAGRIRGEVDKLLESPLSPADIAAAQARFQLLLEPQLLDPPSCAKDPRAFALARAMRGQLKDAPAKQALETAADKWGEARERFTPKQTAAVIAGGAIR